MKTLFFTLLTLPIFYSPLLMASSDFQKMAPDTRAVEEKASGSTLVGFQDWKQNRVVKAKNELEKFKTPDEIAVATENSGEEKPEETVENSGETPVAGSEKSEKPSDSEEKEESSVKKLSKEDQQRAEKLRQLEFNLEIAQGLTIHDFFALYLKDKSQEQVAEVITKLSPEELSELLVAYRKSLYGTPGVQKAEKSESSTQL